MTTIIESYYEIQVKGETIGLVVLSNEGGEFCGQYEFRLEDGGNIPFRLKDERAIRRFLRKGSTPWYNASSEEFPNWGSYKKKDFSFVKVDVVKTVSPVVIEMEEDFNLRDVFKKNFMKVDLRPNLTRKFGKDVHAVMVIRDRKSLEFDVAADKVADLVRDKFITFGFGDTRAFSFIDVELGDGDFYYIVMNQIDD